MADYPAAFTIGAGSRRLENVDEAELRKIHTQLQRADANHMRERFSPAVDPGRPEKERVKALTQKVTGSREV